MQLVALVESLQNFQQIQPKVPQRTNRSGYVSRFQCEIEGVAEEVGGISADEVEVEVEVASAEEVEDGGFLTVEVGGVTGVSVESDPSNCSVTQASVNDHTKKKDEIRQIFLEEISWEEKSLKVMRQITSWDELYALSDVVMSQLPPLPTQLSNEWHGKLLKDVHKNYADYIPLSIGERVVYQSTSNGNCIYNTISLILYGNETMATTLKLSSVVHMVDDIIPFSKYIVEEFKESTNMWIQAATQTQKDVSTAEGVQRCCMIEMVDTVKHPYKDGGIFHLHLLAHLLGRPIQQHCAKNYEQYQQMLFPPLHALKSPAAIHLVWVPAKPRSQYASVNHVVPAVCHLSPYGCHLEECAFLGVGVCAFMDNFNSKESYGWVECTLCGQWVHDKCMQVDAAKYSMNDDFPCGCDIIRNGLVPLKRFC